MPPRPKSRTNSPAARRAGGAPLSDRSQRVLHRLASGPVPGRRLSIAPADIAELIAAGLVAQPGEQGLPTLTDLGKARVARETVTQDDAFAAQHRRLVEGEVDWNGQRQPVLLDDAESPLAWLRRRRDKQGRPLIDDVCYAAGERFRTDLTIALMVPRLGVDWSRFGHGLSPGGGGPGAASDAALAARQRVLAASRAVGSDLAGLLVDICGFLKGLETVERERDWPGRSAKVVLILALRRLAEHYGIAAEARGPARSPGIRRWAAPDKSPETPPKSAG